MTARIESLLVAEAAVTDARGSLTLVGYEPLVWIVPGFPHTIRVAIVLTLEDDVDQFQTLIEGAQVAYSPSVRSPSGETLMAGTVMQQVGGVPAFRGTVALQKIRAVMVVDTQLLIREPGSYDVGVEVTIKDQLALKAQRSLVIDMPAAGLPFDGQS